MPRKQQDIRRRQTATRSDSALQHMTLQCKPTGKGSMAGTSALSKAMLSVHLLVQVPRMLRMCLFAVRPTCFRTVGSGMLGLMAVVSQ